MDENVLWLMKLGICKMVTSAEKFPFDAKLCHCRASHHSCTAAALRFRKYYAVSTKAKNAYKLRSVHLSVRSSVRMSSAPTARISVKFDTGNFYENPSRQ